MKQIYDNTKKRMNEIKKEAIICKKTVDYINSLNIDDVGDVSDVGDVEV